MKRSYSETTSGLTIPLSKRRRGGGGDQYLYFILTCDHRKYRHFFHRVRVSDLMISSSSKSRRRARNHSYSQRHRHEYEKPQKLPKPILKLRYDSYPPFMAFFSALSKIYMVGGQEMRLGRKVLGYRTCYVFDTCKENNPSKVVKEGPPMVYGKYQPIVLGPLHGKFYVLDWTLASNDLEEFDPQTETWTPLPSASIAPPEDEEDNCFPFRSTHSNKYRVVSQAIVGDRILLSTHRKGIYAFNVISHIWEHWSSWDDHGKARLPYYGGSEFCHGFWYAFPVPSYRLAFPVSSYHLSAYYFDEDNRRFQPYRAHGLRRLSRLVKYDTNNNIVPMGKRTLFVVHSGNPHKDPYPYNITVDMYKFARFRVQSGEKKHPKVSEQYSATFTHKMANYTEYLAACLVVSAA